jgi:hypothetical protein
MAAILGAHRHGDGRWLSANDLAVSPIGGPLRQLFDAT